MVVRPRYDLTAKTARTSEAMSEPEEVQRLLQALISEPLTPFPKRGEKLQCSTERGVYIVYRDDGAILHVGNTPRGKDGLFGRLDDHLHGRSSFSRALFNRKGHLLREGHSYRCLPVENAKKRVLLEALAIGVLCPEHLGTWNSRG